MKYRTYKIVAWFGENVNRHFEVVAISIEAALNDIKETTNEEITFYSWGLKDD